MLIDDDDDDTVAVHFRYDRYLRRLVNQFFSRNTIVSCGLRLDDNARQSV